MLLTTCLKNTQRNYSKKPYNTKCAYLLDVATVKTKREVCSAVQIHWF